ncbi:MAG: FtsQ-type POTRA domain-containing protein [Chloroflexi bacterium]|nr:FtsQ-type POTRA domain-containing protein [Chloroflexota bacterium]
MRLNLRFRPQKRRASVRSGLDTRAAAVGAARASQWVRARLLSVLGLAMLALVVVLAAFILFGRDFRVQFVQVEGTELLKAEDIRNGSGLFGRSIVTVNTSRVKRDLLARYGMLQDVTVRREMPNKVTVQVREHAARWVWESGGRYWWLRDDGTVITEMPDAGGLPVIHDVQALYREPRGYIPGIPWELANDMLEVLPGIVAFDYTRPEGLVVYVTDAQWPVYLGTQGDCAKKVEILRALVKRLQASQETIVFIDLRNEIRPAYKKSA